jgi:CBS domain-containing protein
MKLLTVQEVVVPLEEGVPLAPSVSPEDRITDALKVMLKNELKRIAVVEENEPMGMIRLDDALRKVGLEGETKARERQSIVIHGRKIIVEK